MMESVIWKFGIGQDYTSFACWDSDVDGSPELFHIGLICPNEYLCDDFQGSWRMLRNALYDFMLLNVKGEIIAWKIKDDIFISQNNIEDLFTLTEPIQPNYNKAIEGFLKEHFGYSDPPDEKIYVDGEYTERIKLILPDFEKVSAELIHFLAKHPEYLNELHWRKFEELLTKLFSDMGYESTLVPGRGDEGIDIRLISKDSIGQMLTLVQAKKYNPKYPIELEPVQALFGAVSSEGASRGLLVSTSGFQPAADKFARKHPYRLEIAGPREIQHWLKKYSKGP